MAQLQGSSCQSVSMGGALSPSSLLKTSSLPVLPSNVVLHPAAPSTDSSLVSTRCDCTIHPASSSLNPIAVISSPSRLQRRLYYWDAACHGSSPRRPTLVRTQSCANAVRRRRARLRAVVHVIAVVPPDALLPAVVGADALFPSRHQHGGASELQVNSYWVQLERHALSAGLSAHAVTRQSQS
ncbi:unnamed protein product [Closterium sp. NIES-64]|nr:unnamed protein product [Closterium sp. NIES-64]